MKVLEMSRILSGLAGIGVAVITIMICIFAKSAWVIEFERCEKWKGDAR